MISNLVIDIFIALIRNLDFGPALLRTASVKLHVFCLFLKQHSSYTLFRSITVLSKCISNLARAQSFRHKNITMSALSL